MPARRREAPRHADVTLLIVLRRHTIRRVHHYRTPRTPLRHDRRQRRFITAR